MSGRAPAVSDARRPILQGRDVVLEAGGFMSDGSFLAVTVAQPLVHIGHVEANIADMAPMVEAGARDGASLVVFSECGLTGYDKRGIGVGAAIALDDQRLDRVGELARQHDVAVITGLYERADEKIYNTALLVEPTGARQIYRKHQIVGYELNHTPVEAAPRELKTFRLNGLELGVLICADSGAPGIHEELAAHGCDAFIALTAGVGEAEAAFDQSSVDLTDPDTRSRFLDKQAAVCFPRQGLDRALSLDMGLIACNQAGWDAEQGYFQPGHSMIVDHSGELTALIPGQFSPQFLRPRHATGFVTRRAGTCA